MTYAYDTADLPVILLYNLDPVWSTAEQAEIKAMAHGVEAALIREGHPVEVVSLEDDKLEKAMAGCKPDQQIVFNWCEEVPGIPHSSAEVARTLESLGFTFTGAGSKALLFSQNKPGVKGKLSQKHIPTPNWQVFRHSDHVDWSCFPAIVKPAYEHCSFGITHEAVVHDKSELSRQVAHILENFHEPVLVEDFIDGREFHVNVVGNGKLQVLPVAEMDFSSIGEDRGRLCTYDSKFSPASTDYQMIQLRLPADLSTEAHDLLEKTTIAAYKATDCRDYARMDIRERDGVFYILDVNPNADICPDTSLALAAELAGFTHGQFCSLLVKLAANRHPLLSHKVKKERRPVLNAVAFSD